MPTDHSDGKTQMQFDRIIRYVDRDNSDHLIHAMATINAPSKATGNGVTSTTGLINGRSLEH